MSRPLCAAIPTVAMLCPGAAAAGALAQCQSITRASGAAARCLAALDLETLADPARTTCRIDLARRRIDEIGN